MALSCFSSGRICEKAMREASSMRIGPHSATVPSVSATTAPLWPIGNGGPMVESRDV